MFGVSQFTIRRLRMERLDLNGRTSGKMKVFCPLCRGGRRDKRDKSVSVNLDKGFAKCHYCGGVFLDRRGDSRIAQEGKNILLRPSDTSSKGEYDAVRCPPLEGAEGGYSKPALIQKHTDWFLQQRAITKETLERMGISSKEEWMPQTSKKEWVICFNYFEKGELVNAKFRDLQKNFKMISGSELIPYNIDGIYHQEECIITEGETDALSFAEIGRTDVISVPAGANTNLVWMDRFVETHLEDKRVIYIAVDSDRKGKELSKELVRRLGAERCRIAAYPDDCKDANEVLVKYGGEALIQVLAIAPEVPLEGVFTLKNVSEDLRSLFEKGMQRGAETGWGNLDKYCTFEKGRLCVIGGIPGSGKSEFLDELLIRLNLRHGWKAAFFSPENMPLPYHLRKLMEKATGQRFKQGQMSETLYSRGETYLEENFSSILPDDNYTVDNILDKALQLVRRKGIDVLGVDPFNRFEHQIPAGQTETQYISTLLDKFTNFAVRNNILVILVVHPKKMYKDPGIRKEPVPTLYDMNGSAAFFNKTDFGLTVERDYDAGVTRIHVQKVKFRHLGGRGIASFVYNTTNGRYSICEEDEDMGKTKDSVFDNESWLTSICDSPPS